MLILQNDKGNQYSTTTIVAAITSSKKKKPLPTHVSLTADGLEKRSIVLLEQLRTVDIQRLGRYRVVGGTAFNGPSEISRKVIHSILQQNPPAGGAEIMVTPTLEHFSGNPQEVIEILKELQEHDIQVATAKKEPMLTCLPFYLDIYTTFTSAIARMTGEHKIPENTHTM